MISKAIHRQEAVEQDSLIVGGRQRLISNWASSPIPFLFGEDRSTLDPLQQVIAPFLTA